MSDPAITLIALTFFGAAYALATYLWSRSELKKIDKAEDTP